MKPSRIKLVESTPVCDTFVMCWNPEHSLILSLWVKFGRQVIFSDRGFQIASVAQTAGHVICWALPQAVTNYRSTIHQPFLTIISLIYLPFCRPFFQILLVMYLDKLKIAINESYNLGPLLNTKQRNKKTTGDSFSKTVSQRNL